MSREIFEEAYQHFMREGRHYEYGRDDKRWANDSPIERKTDRSRYEQDLDGDGLYGVDCSSLVWRGLKNAGYDVGESAVDFNTATLFQGDSIKPYAREHFDVISAADAKETSGPLEPGDILMFKGSGGQHVAIFKGYNERGYIEFFGSQISTGPATVTGTTAPGGYWNGGTMQIVGALRAKPEFRVRDPDHGYQTGPIDYINTDIAAAKRAPDESIRLMQQQLRELGYTDNRGRPLADDGEFGPATRAAVGAFQQDHDLAITGQPTPETKQAIGETLLQQALQPPVLPYSPFYDLPITAPTLPFSLTDPAHDGYGLFCQGLACVEQLNAEKGVANDIVRDTNVAGALAVKAATEGLTRIDVVAVNENASRVTAKQENGFLSKFATLDTMQAINTSLEQSSAQWPQAAERQQQQLIEQQSRQQAAQALQPAAVEGYSR